MFPYLLLAVPSLSLLLLEWRSGRCQSRQGREEELASSLEDGPRERRKERRYAVSETSVTATLLGDERAPLVCRILDRSRSGMRIAISQPLPQNAQVSVAWGNECFVGTSCYSFVKGDEHILGLRVIASTCPAPGFTTDVKYQWNDLRCRVEKGASMWRQRTSRQPAAGVAAGSRLKS